MCGAPGPIPLPLFQATVLTKYPEEKLTQNFPPFPLSNTAIYPGQLKRFTKKWTSFCDSYSFSWYHLEFYQMATSQAMAAKQAGLASKAMAIATQEMATQALGVMPSSQAKSNKQDSAMTIKIGPMTVVKERLIPNVIVVHNLPVL